MAQALPPGPTVFAVVGILILARHAHKLATGQFNNAVACAQLTDDDTAGD